MKHLLNKKLSVKQIIALILLPLAILGTTIIFSIGDTPIAAILKSKTATDSVTTNSSDTTALGNLNAYVDSLNNSEQLFSGSWSFCLADADRGKIFVPSTSTNVWCLHRF